MESLFGLLLSLSHTESPCFRGPSTGRQVVDDSTHVCEPGNGDRRFMRDRPSVTVPSMRPSPI